VNCEKEMREKNEMGGRMYMCGGGEEKKKGRRYMGGGEKKKKGNKKEKRNGEWGLHVW
jgi:hypothetical protein